MDEDYRNTKYCPKICNLKSQKENVRKSVLDKHPRAKDMHIYVSQNDELFKEQFAKAYNWKCAYCGVSVKIISRKMFEIDHFIPKQSKVFGHNKTKAGYIENLVLSCYECNRSKGSHEWVDKDLHKINPDGIDILKSFVRDNEYYIKISDEMKNDATVNSFYNQLCLGNQLHRIDYLLMNMLGLAEKISSTNNSIYKMLLEAINILREKRNLMV